jgi:hypothetical protein
VKTCWKNSKIKDQKGYKDFPRDLKKRFEREIEGSENQEAKNVREIRRYGSGSNDRLRKAQDTGRLKPISTELERRTGQNGDRGSG